MAKREIKAVQAEGDVAAIIDRGADIDAQIKNLGFEDKGIKTQITNKAMDQLDEGELSVRLLGKTSAAVVSGVEKIELNPAAEQYPQVLAAVRSGLLNGIVSRTLGITIAAEDVERAAAELAKAGITATVTETVKLVDTSVLTDPSHAMVGSVQEGEAVVALSKCVKNDLSFRVKYERV